MIGFVKISQIEHLPMRLQDRLLAAPKGDIDFLLPMFDGKRRSGRTTMLSVFYADRLIERGYVTVLDHFFSEDSWKVRESDTRLLGMVVREMQDRGYLFGFPRSIKYVDGFFHRGSNPLETTRLVMATIEDVLGFEDICQKSIAHTTAFNKFMERI